MFGGPNGRRPLSSRRYGFWRPSRYQSEYVSVVDRSSHSRERAAVTSDQDTLKTSPWRRSRCVGRAGMIILAVAALAAAALLSQFRASFISQRVFSPRKASATPSSSSTLQLNPPHLATANVRTPPSLLAVNPSPSPPPSSSSLPSSRLPSSNPRPQSPPHKPAGSLPASLPASLPSSPLSSPLNPHHLDPTSGCSCYRLRNEYCCKQALCVCHSVCFNGSSLLAAPSATAAANGQPTSKTKPPLPCLPPQYTLNQVNASDIASSSRRGETVKDVLSPIPCTHKVEFSAYLNMALSEAPIRGGLHAASLDTWQKWVGQGGGEGGKGGSAEWRDGSTLLIPLDDPTTNVAHFIGKAAQILLVNNASLPTALPFITRFLLPRTPAAASRMRQHGQHGWIPSVLHMLLRIAIEPLLNYTMHSPRLNRTTHPHRLSSFPPSLQSLAAAISPEALVGASTVDGSIGAPDLLGGVVEFESAFRKASDEHPMCFHRLVLPGYLKAITFPGGMEEAEMFKQRLKEVFPHAHSDAFQAMASPGNASPEEDGTSTRRTSPGRASGRLSADPVRLLYITRNASLTRGRRVMTAASSTALLKLFHQLKFQVAEVEFTPLTFAHQLALVQLADIIVSLHGAGLTNPASFARSDSVLLEISPYGVFYNLYYFMAVNAGVTYMLHQCTSGPAPIPPGDAEFQGVSPFDCDHDPKCKQYRTHDRPVNLGERDIEELEELLKVAHKLVMEARKKGKREAGRRLRRTYGKLCVSRKREKDCRMNLLRSPIADPTYECVLSMDCPYVSS